jgi:quercetin dioxygenase-like cupin family protein
MKHVVLDQVAEASPFPGFRGRFIRSAQTTSVYWTISAGAELPLHSHVHEQVTHTLDGRFEIVVDGRTTILEAGSVLVIPSNSPHSGRALTDCKILDVFSPVREDYIAFEQA